MPANSSINQLLSIMARLRDPEHGCPWDLEQDFASIAPYTIEEAFEVAEAIARGDMDDLRDELGDLLLQVVFHARMAEEQGSFEFSDVVKTISDKMIRRHPHVFADQQGASITQIKDTWEAIKAAERESKGRAHSSQLDGVPEGLPALQRAAKLQKKAARVGFDWPEARQVLQQVRAELDELEQAMEGGDREEVADELGDVLFSVVNLSRHLKLDADQALRQSSDKFVRRFRKMERLAAEEERTLASLDADSLETLWIRAKKKLV